MNFVTYFVALVWACGSLAGLLLLADARQADFDPNFVLMQRSMDIKFDDDVRNKFESLFGNVENRAFHFTNTGCSCTSVAKPHINSVKALLSEKQFENHAVTVSAEMELADMIPSAPAVAIFDANSELVYIGPYSTGMICTAGNGFVESIISNIKGRINPAAVVISDARGCYCNNSVA